MVTVDFLKQEILEATKITELDKGLFKIEFFAGFEGGTFMGDKGEKGHKEDVEEEIEELGCEIIEEGIGEFIVKF